MSEESLLVSDKQVAELLGISRRTVNSWRACGKLPPVLRIRGLTRWRRSDIVLWVEWGCPNLEKFEQTKNQK